MLGNFIFIFIYIPTAEGMNTQIYSLCIKHTQAALSGLVEALERKKVLEVEWGLGSENIKESDEIVDFIALFA